MEKNEVRVDMSTRMSLDSDIGRMNSCSAFWYSCYHWMLTTKSGNVVGFFISISITCLIVIGIILGIQAH